MGCNPKEIRDKFISAIKGQIKSTKNIQVYNNEIIITWDGKTIKNKNAAYTIAINKAKEINELGKTKFGEVLQNLTYAHIDGQGGDFIRVSYGIPVALHEAYRVKSEQSTIEAYQKNTIDRDINFFNGDDALKEQEDRDNQEESHFDMFPSTLELDQTDKDVFEFYNKATEFFTDIAGDSPTKEEIEQILFKYNEDRGIDRTKIPDITDPEVKRDLKMIRHELIFHKQESFSNAYARKRNKRDREVDAAIKNSKHLKQYVGVFKPFAKQVSDLLKSIEQQLKIVRTNLKEAQKNNNTKQVAELLNRIKDLEAVHTTHQDIFDHIVQNRTLSPMLSVIMDSVVELSKILSSEFTLRSDYEDKLFSASKYLDYIDAIINDDKGVYITKHEKYVVEDTAKHRVFSGSSVLNLLPKEDVDARSLSEALIFLKDKKAKLIKQYLERIVNDSIGTGLQGSINMISQKIDDPEIKAEFLENLTSIIASRNKGALDPTIKATANRFINTTLHASSLSAELQKEISDFTRGLFVGDLDYINIYEQVKDLSVLNDLFLDISTSDRVADQVLAKVIQETTIDTTAKVTSIQESLSSSIKNLEKSMSTMDILKSLFRKSKSGLLTNELISKYSRKYDELYREARDAFKEKYDIEKDINLSTTEKIDKITKIKDTFREFMVNTRSSLDLGILFGDQFKDISYLDIKQYTDVDKKNHLDTLRKEVGSELDVLLKTQENLNNEYLSLRKAKLDSLEQFITFKDYVSDRNYLELKYTNIREEGGKIFGIKKEDYDKFIIDDIRENPLVYSNFVKNNETIDYKDNAVFASARYYESIPKKYDNGKETGFYDKEFETIESNPDLKNMYDITRNTIHELNALDSNTDTNSSTITLTEKSLFESIVSKVEGKNIITTKELIAKALSLQDVVNDNLSSLSRVYGANVGKDHSDIIKLNNNYDNANRAKIDKLYFLEREEVKVELLKDGYKGEDLEKELSKRTKDLRENIVTKLVQEAVQDPLVTIMSMVIKAQDLTHRNSLLPTIRLYKQGLDLITKGASSTILDTNAWGKQLLDVAGKPLTKDSSRREDKYTTFLNKWAGFSIRKGILNSVEVKTDIEKDGVFSSFFRTPQEKEEIERLQKLYKSYEKLHADGKILDEELITQRGIIQMQLAKLNFNRYHLGEIVLQKLHMGAVAISLYYASLGPLFNRLGGTLLNNGNVGKYYSKESYSKAVKDLNKLPRNYAFYGGALSSIITASLIASPVAFIPMIIAGWGGYAIGKKLGDLRSNSNPKVQKITNIMQAWDVFKFNETVDNPDSVQSKFEKRVEGLKPMALMKTAEFFNATEQALAFLYEMKVEVMQNGVKKAITWEDLFNQDGSLVQYDSYIIPSHSQPVDKKTMSNYLSGVQFMISSNTGQYNEQYPIKASETSVGRVFITFNKWAVNEIYNWIDSKEYRNYTIPNPLTGKSYTVHKGRLKSLSDIYGSTLGAGITSLYAGSAAYIGAGVLGAASMASFAIPMGIGASIAYAAIKSAKSQAKKNTSVLQNLNELQYIIPFASFMQQFKDGKSSQKQFFSNLSDVDRTNLQVYQQMATVLTSLLILVAATTYMLKDRDKDDDKLSMLLRLINYGAKQTGSNVGGVMNANSFVDDVKNGFGASTPISVTSKIGTTLKDFIYAMGYKLTGEDKDGMFKDAVYQSKSKHHEKGDYKFMEEIQHNIPGISKYKQVRHVVEPKN